MKKIISCCGCVCSECLYYPNDCAGCPSIEGQAFWLEYTGGAVCEIYECCVLQKKLSHCGQCAELPCARYDLKDPTKTEEENTIEQRNRLETLRRLQEETQLQ